MHRRGAQARPRLREGGRGRRCSKQGNKGQPPSAKLFEATRFELTDGRLEICGCTAIKVAQATRFRSACQAKRTPLPALAIQPLRNE